MKLKMMSPDDLDGWFGPSTNQKREIAGYVSEAWIMWEQGYNPAEVTAKIGHQAAEKDATLYMDYFPPNPEWVKKAVKSSFASSDRKDYAFLGYEGDVTSATTQHFFRPSFLDLFGLSEDKARRYHESHCPRIFMSQEWPPSLRSDKKKTNQREDKEYWDYESLLGQYLPRDNTIVLYSRGIRRCSHELSLDNLLLALIVSLHEIAHWSVHYYPVAGHDAPWDTEAYVLADNWIHETLAQWITYHTCRLVPDHLTCFENLNKHQSDKYKAYRELPSPNGATVISSIGQLRSSRVLAESNNRWRRLLA